jgi:tight adherence protein C
MNLSLLPGSAAIIGAIVVLWYSFGASVKEEAQSLNARLDQRKVMLRASANERTLSPLAGAVMRRVRALLPTSRVRKLEAKLAQAGLDEKWTIEKVLVAKVLLAIVMFVLFFFRFTSEPSGGGFLLMLFATAFGFFVPNAIIDRRRTDRKEAIRAQVADSIDQLNVMVRAGLGIDASLARLSQQNTGALAEEFGRVIQDMRFGLSRAVAFANLAERVDVPELSGFVTALSHAERLGVPISQTLVIQSQEMRERRRQMAEEKAMKLPVKLLFPMVMFILPVLFIVLLGPAVMKIFDSF